MLNLSRWGGAVAVAAPLLMMGCDRPNLQPDSASVATTESSITPMSLNQVRGLRAAAPDSIYLTDADKTGIFTLDVSDKKSEDNTGVTLVTTNGDRYKRVYAGSASAAWFNISPQDNDIGPELQAALNSTNDVFIPDGEYTQLTKVILRSNVTIRANPGKVTIKLTGSQYISFQNFWLEQDLNNITFDGLSWLVASTARVEGSYGPITIDGPSVRNLTVRNCRSIHTSSTANVNWFFLKVQPGKVTRNILVTNNYAKGARMGAEFLSQHQPVPYLGKGITVTNNNFENCGFGISVAGSFDGVDVSSNYLKNCPTYGVEFAGWLHNAKLTNNKFEGKFISLFAGNWENDGDGNTSGNGMYVNNNSTVNLVTGKWQVRNGYNMLMQNNNLTMTGLLDISGATNNARFINNRFVSTTENKVIQVNDVANLTFSNNYISNEGVMNSWVTIIINGRTCTNNSFFNNTIVRSSGGLLAAGNGATYQFNNNHDQNGKLLSL